MDTKTGKSEALYILSVIERGSADREFIGEARRKFYDLMNAHGCDRRDYLDSVDACLTLFPECDLRIKQSLGAIEVGWLWTVDLYTWEQDLQAYHKRLEMALLKVYWLQQPD